MARARTAPREVLGPCRIRHHGLSPAAALRTASWLGERVCAALARLVRIGRLRTGSRPRQHGLFPELMAARPGSAARARTSGQPGTAGRLILMCQISAVCPLSGYRPGAVGPLGCRSGSGMAGAAFVVPAAKCGVYCLSLVGNRICWRVGGTGDMPVEALFPKEGREHLKLASSSGWSRILGIDAVGGPPHCDLADEGSARVASRCCPDRLGVTSAGVVWTWSARSATSWDRFARYSPHMGWAWSGGGMPGSQGNGAGVGRRERCKPPVEDGGHVTCGSEVASAGGCLQVAEWVLTGFGRDGRAGVPAGSAKRVRR